MPEVSITATNAATGVVTKTSSRTDGSYMFAALSPGTYNLTAEKTGFKSSALTGIKLLVDQKATLDIHLESGLREHPCGGQCRRFPH